MTKHRSAPAWTPNFVPEGLSWLRPSLEPLRTTYRGLRRKLDSLPAFEQALATVLDDRAYDRAQSFFDGGSDALYGDGAGERARVALREGFEESTRADRMDRPETRPRQSTGPVEVTNIDAFYDENPARRRSPEVAFGDEWSMADQPGCWHVFWLADTGELGAMRCVVNLVIPGHGFSADLEELGNLGRPKQYPEIEVLTIESDIDKLQRELSGWERAQGEQNSYEWLRRRLRLP